MDNSPPSSLKPASPLGFYYVKAYRARQKLWISQNEPPLRGGEIAPQGRYAPSEGAYAPPEGLAQGRREKAPEGFRLGSRRCFERIADSERQ